MPLLFSVFGLFVAGFGSIGPVLFGFCYDATGSYNLAFIATGVLCLCSATCLALLKPPTKKTAPIPSP